ncbi:MAG TPA: glycosyl hydrolase family 18 protein [Candidatus Paceibacterota bacterium]
MKKHFGLFFLIASAFFSSEAAFAASSISTFPQDIVRIFYYREGTNARNSLFNNPTKIDILAPQSYSVDSDGNLAGAIETDVLDFARTHDIKIMPLVTNKGFGQGSLATVLNDSSKQDALVSALINESKKHNFYGFQVDFEQMAVSYKDKFSAFIKKLADAMKKENLITSVAVISKISDNPADYKEGLYDKLIGAYDYSALAGSTDFISVMSYDDPDSKGAIARYEWLQKVVAYSSLHIPKEKISLGLALYYWSWRNSTQKLISIGGYEGMQNVLKKYDPTYVYSTIQHAPYLTYVKNKVRHTMWYENGRSVKEKISIIKAHGFHGFSAWALGLEVPSVFDSV